MKKYGDFDYLRAYSFKRGDAEPANGVYESNSEATGDEGTEIGE